jgi:hypothetical protein
MFNFYSNTHRKKRNSPSSSEISSASKSTGALDDNAASSTRVQQIVSSQHSKNASHIISSPEKYRSRPSSNSGREVLAKQTGVQGFACKTLSESRRENPPTAARKAWQPHSDVVQFEDDIANVFKLPLYSSTSDDSSDSFSNACEENHPTPDAKRWRRKQEFIPASADLSKSFVQEDKSSQDKLGLVPENTNNKTCPTENAFSELLFKNILSEIRGMNVLSSYQMHYVGSLSHDELCKIIEVYNVVIQNVNEIL